MPNRSNYPLPLPGKIQSLFALYGRGLPPNPLRGGYPQTPWEGTTPKPPERGLECHSFLNY